MKTTTVKKILIALYALSTIWWLTIFARGIKETTENYLFNIPMAVIPMVVGVYVVCVAYRNADRYTGLAKRALFFCASALIFWGTGNLVYLYYNLCIGNPAPHILWPDFFYATASIFWVIGLFFILILTGHKKLASKSIQRLVLYSVLFTLFVCVLYVFVANRIQLPNFPRRLTFDVFYTGLDLIVFSELCLFLYVLIWYKETRRMQRIAWIFLGFCFNYLADLFYSIFYQFFYVGSWIDMLFLSGVFFQGLGVLWLLDDASDFKLRKQKERPFAARSS